MLAQEWYGVNSSSSQNLTTMKAIPWACPVSFPNISPLLFSTGMRLESPTGHLGSGPSSTPTQKSLAASENLLHAIFCDSFPVSHLGTPSCLLLCPSPGPPSYLSDGNPIKTHTLTNTPGKSFLPQHIQLPPFSILISVSYTRRESPLF